MKTSLIWLSLTLLVITKIPFLDVLVRINSKGVIGTTLLRKSTAGNSLLRADSAHPIALKKSIPFAQYMWLRRICASKEDFEIQAGHLQERFLARGYPRSLLKRAYHKARREDRHHLLYKNVDKTSTSDLPHPLAEPTRLILTYSSQHQLIRDAIEKYWFLLIEDSVLSSYVSHKPSITYRRARSLKDDLVQSHFVDPMSLRRLPAITTSCGACEACQFLDVRNKVSLPNGEIWTFLGPHFRTRCGCNIRVLQDRNWSSFCIQT